MDAFADICYYFFMQEFPLAQAFTFIESGPVIMLTTSDAGRPNIMVASWHMVIDFHPRIAIATGDWNYSFAALMKTKECVISIPTISMLDTVISIGTTSGEFINKFAKFNLTPQTGAKVGAPLINECMANIECRVIDHIKSHDMVILEGVKAWIDDNNRRDKTVFHYRGDGTFVADGKIFQRYKRMRPKMAIADQWMVLNV
jgi:flavin reductase (DIM6/NTAB) family NADH-FMN oxidoreductase RutF